MKRILPPSLFALTAVGMVLLSLVVPVRSTASGWLRLTGIAVGLSGAVLTVGGSRQFQRIGTNINTFLDPDRLVATGLFAYSRNPMYLGFVTTLVGLALGLGSVSPWLGPIVFLVVADRFYVPFEEDRMRVVFGRDYVRYCSQVLRWIGRRPDLQGNEVQRAN